MKPRIRKVNGNWWCFLQRPAYVDPHEGGGRTPREAFMNWAHARKAAGLLPWG